MMFNEIFLNISKSCQFRDLEGSKASNKEGYGNFNFIKVCLLLSLKKGSSL